MALIRGTVWCQRPAEVSQENLPTLTWEGAKMHVSRFRKFSFI
ncbi:hypothetical protein OH492_04095 [Vibrio chagasii]|nr:hypothetical protein [Vibrio chagasii]